MAPRRWFRYLIFLATFSLVFGFMKIIYISIHHERYIDLTNHQRKALSPAEYLDSILNSLGNVSYLNTTAYDVAQVVLVTYQRTGSSFLGELFNRNPHAFVWFEPLDAVYSALFGTAEGFNVPADIWNYPNGSERILASAEKMLLAQTSTAILSCRFEALATEVLVHHFIMMFIDQHRHLAPYAKCALSDEKHEKACRKCNNELSSICNQRFDPTSPKLKMCANELSKRFSGLDVPYPGIEPDSRTKGAVDKYYKCMEPCRKKAMQCIHHLKKPCESANIRSIKPVRLNMETAGIIKQNIPNAKLIHNLRDPRGVVHSRKHTSESFQSAYAITQKSSRLGKKVIRKTTIDLTKEAKLFCRNTAHDCKLRKQIESEYSDDVLQVVYESYASQPHEVASGVYKFIGDTIPNSVTEWLTSNTAGKDVQVKQQTSRQANVTMARWQSELTVSAMKEIDAECQNLYSQVNHIWPCS